jgi:hypothetical protein
MRMFLKFYLFISFLLINLLQGFSQAVPASEENIPHLITFGPKASPSWGDDDFTQIFFFIVPATWKNPFFIRVYDPDTGGSLDEIKGTEDTKLTFSIYGGKGAYSEKAATSPQPTGNYKSGTLLTSRTFDNNRKFDGKWYSFGPFNPVEGEFDEKYKGYIFKVIAQGIEGNDGNIYNYFLSSISNDNKQVEGSNSFTYEYSFRMWDEELSVSHIYPFINENVVSIKIHTFDFDKDGQVRIVSRARKAESVSVSDDNHWTSSEHQISEKEIKTSLDIQIIKKKKSANNNVVFYITNQYGESQAFFSSPIGGIPKYKFGIEVHPSPGP